MSDNTLTIGGTTYVGSFREAMSADELYQTLRRTFSVVDGSLRIVQARTAPYGDFGAILRVVFRRFGSDIVDVFEIDTPAPDVETVGQRMLVAVSMFNAVADW